MSGAGASGSAPDRVRPQLAVLTGAKTVTNVALRWVGPFLPTLERAFSTSTATMTGIMGAAELGGLSTTATGSLLDRGRERLVFVVGLGLVVASSLAALGGHVATFAISYALLVLGVSNLTTAGHAWIGHRVPFVVRGRAIGAFETSWAISLLIGAPLLAILIEWVGWRGPYVALAVATIVAAVVVLRAVPATRTSPPTGAAGTGATGRGPSLPASAWAPMVGSAATAAAGLGVFVVSGAWLEDAHGLSTGGLGLVAAAFGAIELISSSAVALLSDRIGTRRSVLLGLATLVLGLAIMALWGDARSTAVAGLIVFLAGFEYGFVSSLTLVSEAAPETRGRALGISNAIGTIARSGAVVASGRLYESFGMGGPIAMAAGAAGVAMVGTALARHG